MIQFFYDSLETLQKVKFAAKKDYISLWLWVVAAIIICGMFFIGIDTIWSGAYKTFYSIMRSDVLESQLYEWLTTTGANTDTTLPLSGADVTWSIAVATGS